MDASGTGASVATGPQLPSPGASKEETKIIRGAIACRRCRRYRSKCPNTDGQPPCATCVKAGVADECSFIKGNSSLDRRDTRPRKTNRRHQSSNASLETAVTANPSVMPGLQEDTSPTSQPSTATKQTPPGGWQGKPLSSQANQPFPAREDIEAIVQHFFSTVFQVGFLHKTAFMAKMRQYQSHISPFLLLSILATSCADTPTLISKKGQDAVAGMAKDFFDRAVGMAILEIAEPSVEGVQAFYLLAQKDWNEGKGSRSWIFMGIALRMATILGLESPTSYKATAESPAEVQIAEEEARRTVWHLLTADDCLSCSKGRPASDLSSRICIPMPCDEEDFLFGTVANSLNITATGYNTSLLGNVCLVYALWGRATRLACSNARLPDAISDPTSDTDSEYEDVLATAAMWESALSPRLKYTAINLSGYISRQLDLPFAFIHLIFHASHIVVRRTYLANIVRALDPNNTHLRTPNGSNEGSAANPTFWHSCAHDLFEHAYQLIRIAVDYDRSKNLENTISPLMAFGVFQAAAVLTYLQRWHWLCPELHSGASKSVEDALRILYMSSTRFEMAKSWYDTIDATLSSTWGGPSSSSLSAADARQVLEEDVYTVDPLEPVTVHKESFSRSLQPAGGGGESENTHSAGNGSIQSMPLPTRELLRTSAALPKDGLPPGTTPSTAPVPKSDVDNNDFSLENIQTMFANDMPLVDVQDLLAFTGDFWQQDASNSMGWLT